MIPETRGAEVVCERSEGTTTARGFLVSRISEDPSSNLFISWPTAFAHAYYHGCKFRNDAKHELLPVYSNSSSPRRVMVPVYSRSRIQAFTYCACAVSKQVRINIVIYIYM